MMNVERIRELADVIEKQPHAPSFGREGFCMDTWQHPCGTPACIGGWAAFASGKSLIHGLIWNDAQDHLGLSDDQSGDLFYPNNYEGEWSDITPAHAAAVLRNLAETGQVDWSVSPSGDRS